MQAETPTMCRSGRAAVVSDEIPEDVRLKKTVGRLATYLQGYDLMVTTNRWDPAALEAFRTDEFVAGFRGALDDTARPNSWSMSSRSSPTSGLSRRRPGHRLSAPRR